MGMSRATLHLELEKDSNRRLKDNSKCRTRLGVLEIFQILVARQRHPFAVFLRHTKAVAFRKHVSASFHILLQGRQESFQLLMNVPCRHPLIALPTNQRKTPPWL